jgi:hypothetical protein
VRAAAIGLINSRQTTVSATAIGPINPNALQWVLLPLAWLTQTHYSECYCHWPDNSRHTTLSATAIGLINPNALQWVLLPLTWLTQTHYSECYCHWPDQLTTNYSECYCHWPDQPKRTTVSATAIGPIKSDALQWVLLPLARSTQTHYSRFCCPILGTVYKRFLKLHVSLLHVSHKQISASYLSRRSSLRLATGGLHIFPFDYSARHFTLHTLHLYQIPSDHTVSRHVYIQNINFCQPVPEVAHYHTVCIPQHCNFMRVKFMYFGILIF